ncbi:MAG: GTP cyclohydrolase I FolE [Nitrospinota bacterium]|nr:MAG: GTP cyclohydrolase I FolE [Nitrospinota bacterium]
MNLHEIAEAVKTILLAVGEDPGREGLRDTGYRVARMYGEIFSGLDQDPRKELTTLFDEHHEEMVLVKDIPFFSMCEHHLLPFFGTAHVAYIPNGHVVGISKLVRVVDILAKRPQVQERLTNQIANIIMETLHPQGVAVVMQAEHTCMTMRGVCKPGTQVVTSAMRGLFSTNEATRAEVMALIHSP